VVHRLNHPAAHDVRHRCGPNLDPDDHADHGTCRSTATRPGGDLAPLPLFRWSCRPQTLLTDWPMLRKKITIESIALPM